MAVRIAKEGMNLAEVGETIGVSKRTMFRWSIARMLIASDGFPLNACEDLFRIDVIRRGALSGAMTAWRLTETGAEVVNDLISGTDTNPQNFKG